MFKQLTSLAVALLVSFGSYAVEPTTILRTANFSIQEVTISEPSFQNKEIQRPDLMGFNKPKDIFGFAQLRIVGEQFRVCCTPSGYGVKFKF